MPVGTWLFFASGSENVVKQKKDIQRKVFWIFFRII